MARAATEALGTEKERGFCSLFLEVFGHPLPFGAAFGTFSSLASTNPRGSDISKGGGRRRDPMFPANPPGRAEVAEGRRGDSEERKGEKEGKDRERKVNIERKGLHTFGLPGVGSR